MPFLRLGEHAGKELLGNVAFQQPVPILAEHRRHPHPIIHSQADEPAEQQVVIQLLHQHPLASNRVQHLQQQRPQQLLRWDRRPPHPRIQAFEGCRKLHQRLIDHGPDGTKRMALGYPLLQRNVAEHRSLLPVVSTHLSTSRNTVIYRDPGVFQQLARRTMTASSLRGNRTSGLRREQSGPTAAARHIPYPAIRSHGQPLSSKTPPQQEPPIGFGPHRTCKGPNARSQ